MLAMVSQDDEINNLQPNDGNIEVLNAIHADISVVESTSENFKTCLVCGSLAATSSFEMNEKHVCESCWLDCSPHLPNIDSSPIKQTNPNRDSKIPEDAVDTLLVKSFSQVLQEKVQLAKEKGNFIDISMVEEGRDDDVVEVVDECDSQEWSQSIQSNDTYNHDSDCLSSASADGSAPDDQVAAVCVKSFLEVLDEKFQQARDQGEIIELS
jgi:hypothetical protein